MKRALALALAALLSGCGGSSSGGSHSSPGQSTSTTSHSSSSFYRAPSHAPSY